jgi:hypothetical protein
LKRKKKQEKAKKGGGEENGRKNAWESKGVALADGSESSNSAGSDLYY